MSKYKPSLKVILVVLIIVGGLVGCGTTETGTDGGGPVPTATNIATVTPNIAKTLHIVTRPSGASVWVGCTPVSSRYTCDPKPGRFVGTTPLTTTLHANDFGYNGNLNIMFCGVNGYNEGESTVDNALNSVQPTIQVDVSLISSTQPRPSYQNCSLGQF